MESKKIDVILENTYIIMKNISTTSNGKTVVIAIIDNKEIDYLSWNEKSLKVKFYI